MKPKIFFVLAAFIASMATSIMRANPTPAERVTAIQAALREAKLDGWLFYDFRGSDPLAPRILMLGEEASGSRRWYYYIPASGEPTRIVHSIERSKLDPLPGKRLIYRGWEEQHARLRETLSSVVAGVSPATERPKAADTAAATAKKKPLRVAMQYSPLNDIPYISRVDAGTIELVRSFGVELVTSAELVQHDIQQFIARRCEEEGMERENGIVAVNANTANPHYFPTREANLPIKRGDFVLLDIVSKLRQPGAICTDQTWTGYVGESVPEEFTRIFNIVREARDAATEFVRKNVREGKSIRGAEVDDVSRGVIKRAGYGDQFTHRTGHSIGEEGHGNGVNIDNFETRDSRRITPGVCFSIEPGIYLEGKFGVRSEIDVYVAEKDIEVTGQPIQTEIVAILKAQ
ncbi:MAG: M24 family metallopeptidase [Verrucomicrobiaceae bacterium]|nr:M24 family metallopeptidase [Verrucomicrobiaceae bacterium]